MWNYFELENESNSEYVLADTSNLIIWQQAEITESTG